MIKVSKIKLPTFIGKKNNILNNNKYIECIKRIYITKKSYLYSPTLNLYITKLPLYSNEVLNFILDTTKSDKEKIRFIEYEFTYYFKLSAKKRPLISDNYNDIESCLKSYNDMFKNEEFMRILKSLSMISLDKIITHFYNLFKGLLYDYNNNLLKIFEEEQKKTTYSGKVDPYYRTENSRYIAD